MSSATFELPKIVQIIEINVDEYLKKAQIIKNATSDMKNSTTNNISQTKKSFDNMVKVGDGMSSIGNKLSLGVTLPVTLLAREADNTYKSFDTAFRGVRKTIEMTAEETEAMKETIRELAQEIPHSFEEISAVAEAAGQLGIAKEDIIDFSKIMLNMGVSTNMSSVESAESIAKFANVTGMSIDNADRFSSAVVDLGNKTATTERDIVQMAMRLAGAGSQLGMSEAEILAFSTALSSVGIEAEMGGSAMSKLMLKMRVNAETGEEAQKVINKTGMSLRDLQMLSSHESKGFGELAKSMGYTKEELTGFVETASMMESWASVTGNSTEDFAKIMKEDAVNGVMGFITGLAEMNEKGESAIVTLDQMGLKEVRLGDTIRRATGAKDLFNKALEISNTAWKENTALAQEAELFNESAANQEKIRANKRRDALYELGEAVAPIFVKISDAIVSLAEAFNGLDEGTQEAIIKFGLFAAASGPFLKIGGGITSLVGKIGGGLLNLAGHAGGAAASIGTEAAGAGSATLIGGLKALVAKAGPFALKAAPIALAVGGIAIAGKVVYDNLTQDVIPAVDLFADHVDVKTKEMSDANNEYGNSVEVVTTKISEKTKEQIGAYVKLSDETQRLSNAMYTGLVETSDQNIQKLVGNTKTMSQQIIEANQKQRDELSNTYIEIFSNSTRITGEEKKTILDTVRKTHQERIEETQKLQSRLNEIYAGIQDGSIKYTAETQSEVNTLMEKMKSQAVIAMSQSEIEQNVILERLKGSNTRVTAEMVSESVKQMNKLRDDSIQAAKDKQTEMLRQAEILKANLPKEEKILADKMIEEANRMANAQIEASKNARDNGLIKLKETYSDLVYNVDIKTGEMKDAMSDFSNAFTGDWSRNNDYWNNLKWKDVNINVITKYKTIGNPEKVVTAANGRPTVRYMSHYNGLDAVPYDGYQAKLHKGERILTPREAQNYNDNRDQGLKVTIENFVNNREQDIDALAKELNFYIKRQNVGRG